MPFYIDYRSREQEHCGCGQRGAPVQTARFGGARAVDRDAASGRESGEHRAQTQDSQRVLSAAQSDHHRTHECHRYVISRIIT